jgi:DNA-binding response OmpR family regulator/two-component sensor histidine kinase
MLDLSKLQAGKVTLDLHQNDIIIFVKYLVESHESFAKLQNIGLQFYSEEEELFMDFDAQKVEQVLTNLISNAIKFTPDNGKVLVVAKKIAPDNHPHLQISVRDNGIGISKEQLPYIFDRFHQANPIHENQGTGIGLALVKELLVIMDGSIDVESDLDRGTTFSLLLPIQNKAPFVSQPEGYEFIPIILEEDSIQEEAPDSENELPILLIIEDNADVTYYLQTCLQDQYQILTSRNGNEGIEKAFEILPDLIISDVMMPVKDGFEVCATLKEDERTSHIPIILLTAKATTEDKLTGLTHGADAYLIKPFEKAELIIRLNNLLEIRQTLQKKYSNILISSQTFDVPIETKADSFIEKTEIIVLSHLEDETFSIHELARELHLSRSQVHRKIKALTGMSPAIYIRHIRVQKAKELLASTQLSISEIAYQVGFKSPVYFSQVFKKTFGESPKATRKE